MRKPHLSIGIIGHVDHGNTTLAKALESMHGVELANRLQEPKEAVNALSEYRSRKVNIIQYPLSDKQLKVIKAMQNGAFIESTKGCHRCDGLHLTKQSFQQLKIYGLIEHKEFVGRHSAITQLTDTGKTYNV